MNIPNFSHKLEAILKEKNWKQADLAEKMGITPRHLSKVKNGGDEIAEVFLKKICSALELSLDYFTESQVDRSTDYFSVPFREAGGGMGGGYFSASRKVVSYISLRRDFLLSKTSNLEALSFIHASGDSMSPTIPPDAIVLIDESQIEPINNKIFYIMFNNCFFIKRLEVKNGYVTALLSDNGNRREEIGAQDNIEILGKAILQQTLL